MDTPYEAVNPMEAYAAVISSLVFVDKGVTAMILPLPAGEGAGEAPVTANLGMSTRGEYLKSAEYRFPWKLMMGI
jgi:hypothetical protein